MFYFFLQLPNPSTLQGSTTCLCRQLIAQKNVYRSVCLSSQWFANGKPSAKAFEKDYPEDNVDKNHILIYTASLPGQVHLAYIGLTGMVTVANGTLIWFLLSFQEYSGDIIDTENPGILVGMMASLGVALFVAMQRLVKASVLRLYYNQLTDSYVGVTKDAFLQTVKFPFTMEDMRWRKPGIWGNFFIKNRAVHLYEEQFRSSIHYKALYNQAMLSRPKEQ